jgi:hypothetical protein
MANAGLSYGLNLVKKAPGNRPQPAKRKPLFEDDGDSDGEGNGVEVEVEEIGEIGGLSGGPSTSKPSRPGFPLQSKGGKPPLKPGIKKGPISMYGDLSSTFSSKKHAETAEDLDTNIYDYDAVYDSLKPKKKVTQEDLERKPKYMSNLLAAAAVRKRDATIAEEKKLAREREAEGEEFADKEKFVTSAYKKQQEETRRKAKEQAWQVFTKTCLRKENKNTRKLLKPLNRESRMDLWRRTRKKRKRLRLIWHEKSMKRLVELLRSMTKAKSSTNDNYLREVSILQQNRKMPWRQGLLGKARRCLIETEDLDLLELAVESKLCGNVSHG